MWCHKSKSAFTLIELLLVIVVIGTLVVGLLVSFGGLVHRSQQKAGESMLRNILAAAKDYQAQEGVYPGDISVLVTQGYLSDPNVITSSARGWDYSITTGGNDFSAVAKGAIKQTQDELKAIDKNGNVTDTDTSSGDDDVTP